MVDRNQPAGEEKPDAKTPPPQLKDDASAAAATHGGRYIKYNTLGNVFEITSKYSPPITPLGRGAYGVVCSALNSETGEHVAVKKIANAFGNRVHAKRTLREIKLLRHMDHENIVSIRDVIPPPRREVFNDVYIVYELMDTDLHGVINANQNLSEDQCQYFLYQLLRGLKYIHSANVLHRDLKPSNLLINQNCDLKICDFGLARVVSDHEFMSEYVGTRWYRAPELLLMSSAYTSAIDMWSVGCIFMEMMQGRPLFPGRDHAHQLRLVLELIGSPAEADLGHLSDRAKRHLRKLRRYQKQSIAEKFPHVHPLAVDLVEKMLTFNPSQRITVGDALAHPYMNSLHDITDDDITDEPVCLNPFRFDFDRHELKVDETRELVYQECLAFNPDRDVNELD